MVMEPAFALADPLAAFNGPNTSIGVTYNDRAVQWVFLSSRGPGS
jgi:hypothetical protein